MTPVEAPVLSSGWRKARASIANGACLETASTTGAVLVRDTTDRSGPVLRFPAGAWAEFTEAINPGKVKVK